MRGTWVPQMTHYLLSLGERKRMGSPSTSLHLLQIHTLYFKMHPFFLAKLDPNFSFLFFFIFKFQLTTHTFHLFSHHLPLWPTQNNTQFMTLYNIYIYYCVFVSLWLK